MTKIIKIHISGLETSILQNHIKTSLFPLVRFKAQAVLLASSGVPSSVIAIESNRRESTIRKWLNDWVTGRLSTIFTGHTGNVNATKLTNDQRSEIQQVLQSPPSDIGLPASFWSVPELRSYTETNFGVTYESERSYHFLLRFSNLSFKYPDTFDLKRDESHITERMSEINKELEPLLASDEWEVFAADEVRMDQEAITRQAWLQKGERTIVKVNRKKESQSYLGFLDQYSAVCSIYEMPWQNSAEVLKVFKLFLAHHPNKKICVIWDNAPFHRSQAIRNELSKGGIMDRVHLIAMPPYAPDNNPIEHVWNTAKQQISNIQHATFQETKKAFSGYIRNHEFKYKFS